jgi:drug/metabolite transporter (DMT)-like permease
MMPSTKQPLTRFQSDLILLFTAFVWGSGFIAQRVAAPSLSIFFFNGGRFLLGAILLLPIIRFKLNIPKNELFKVCAAGILLFLAGAFQQAGMKTTTAGNAGFITGLYVVIVPIFLLLFWKQKQPWIIWISAVLAVIGMLLLSTGGKIRLVQGDLLEFIGALLWALHVIVVGLAVKNLHPLHFAIGQFLFCSFLNILTGLIVEPSSIAMIGELWWTIIYNGIASVAIGFTLQGIGQKNAPATDAALILSMEAVFAAILGFLFLQERFTQIQFIGCFLVLIAIVLSQLPVEKFFSRTKKQL